MLVLSASHKPAMGEEPGYKVAMMFSLRTQAPHKATLWEGPGYTPRGQGTCTMFFYERKTEYIANAQTVCTIKPSSHFVERAWVQGYMYM